MITVLYVTGVGRSGSTVMGDLLGQLDGFHAPGELCHVWGRGLHEDWPCSCGEPFSRCLFWSSVMGRVRADVPAATLDVDGMHVAGQSLARTRHVPGMLAAAMRGRAPGAGDGYLRVLGVLYAAVAETAGARVVVDTSKSPAYGRLLRELPGVRLAVLHLVRDPRAVAYSWTRRKVLFNGATEAGPPRYMRQRGPIRVARQWTVWNAVIPHLLGAGDASRYLLLRYEDFVRGPLPALRAVVAMLGEHADPGVLRTEGGWSVRPRHMVSGNPSRFHSGTVRLREDAEWRTAMPRPTRLAVGALTWPLRRVHGY